MSDRIDVGEIVRIDNGDGFQTKPDLDLFDPSTVELTVKPPTQDTIDYSASVVRAAEGLYYADIAVDEPGLWWYRWNGDQVIEEGEFVVRNQRVPDPTS